MFYDKYVALCNSINKSPSAVAIEIGFSKPTVNRWKNGGGVTDANLKKIAEYFGVSVECLIRDSDENKKDPTVSGEADEVTKELYSIWSTASEEERAMLLDMARVIKSRRKKD